MKDLHSGLISDEQLVMMLKNGNKSAMGELYLRHIGQVYNKCLAFAKDPAVAWDFSHDVMIRVMDHIESFKGDSRFSTWLYSITFNYCTDQLRKRNHFIPMTHSMDMEEDDHADLEGALEQEEKFIQAEEALNSLSEEDHGLLSMKYEQNASIHDIQAAYSISESSAKMRLMRARQKAVKYYLTHTDSKRRNSSMDYNLT